MKTERQKLKENFERMRAEKGLLDMKFDLGPGAADAGVEAVCAEVNRIDTLMAEGRFREVRSWGDSNRASA